MHHLSRFGVSLEEDLLAAFDLSIGGMGYQNRSEAIRDLIRDHLIQKKVGQGDSEVIGVEHEILVDVEQQHRPGVGPGPHPRPPQLVEARPEFLARERRALVGVCRLLLELVFDHSLEQTGV